MGRLLNTVKDLSMVGKPRKRPLSWCKGGRFPEAVSAVEEDQRHFKPEGNKEFHLIILFAHNRSRVKLLPHATYYL